MGRQLALSGSTSSSSAAAAAAAARVLLPAARPPIRNVTHPQATSRDTRPPPTVTHVPPPPTTDHTKLITRRRRRHLSRWLVVGAAPSTAPESAGAAGRRRVRLLRLLRIKKMHAGLHIMRDTIMGDSSDSDSACCWNEGQSMMRRRVGGCSSKMTRRIRSKIDSKCQKIENSLVLMFQNPGKNPMKMRLSVQVLHVHALASFGWCTHASLWLVYTQLCGW